MPRGFQKGHKIRVGIKHSEEARRNISDGHKGIKLSEEHKRKLSEIGKGRKHTEEAKLKMSLSQKGRIISEEQKEKLRVARIGIKHSEETKKKMSESQKRIGNGKWNLGKKASNETKLKQSIALKLAYKEGRKKPMMLGKQYSIEERKIQSEKMKGSNAPNYKGGVTPIHMRLRGCYKYKIWRDGVYKRDNYTCVWCGDNRGGNLEPDHIISFSSILDQIRFQYGVENLYEKALESELLWDINNGRTLCKDCHRKTETWGHRSNNKKDI